MPVALAPLTRDAIMVHRNNLVLKRLEPGALAAISPYLTVVSLQQRQLLADTHTRVQNVYFPHSGIISNVVQLLDGGAIEIAMTGSDGQFGARQALEKRFSLHRVVVQVPGMASMIPAARLCELADKLPEFHSLLLKSEEFFQAQVQQAAACNAAHNIENRICKWLLRMHGLVGINIPVTQEFLAQMIGVRRTSVTKIAVELQKAGMIKSRRGHIHISNLDAVRRGACECDGAIQLQYRRIYESEQQGSL